MKGKYDVSYKTILPRQKVPQVFPGSIGEPAAVK